jgi:hypothetical protein
MRELSEIDKATNFETCEHIMNIQRILMSFIQDLQNRLLTHDQSKLRDPELETFVKYTPKLKGSTYGSEEYKTFLKEMKPALDHHYAHNRHHPEHYTEGIEGMNLLDLVEMIVDWKAATMRHADGNIRKSLEINKERFGISPQLLKILNNTVDYLDRSHIDFNPTTQRDESDPNTRAI